MPAFRGHSLPSTELLMAFVSYEKRRNALIVGIARMSVGYSKHPVNPIKWGELQVVW